MKLKALGLVVIALFLLATAGVASAETLDLPKWVIVPEDSINFADVTLFCPLDNLDTVNNVTTCYYQGSLVNATVYFNESTGYPKLVSGAILNAFEFDGNNGEGVAYTVGGNVTDFTVVLSFYSNGTQGAFARLFDYGWMSTGTFIIAANSLGTGLYVDTSDSAGTVTTITSTDFDITERTWYFLAFVKQGAIARLYFAKYSSNHLSKIEKQLPENWVLKPSVTIWIGAKSWDVVWKGKIDEVRYYEGRALSEDEIKALFKAGRMRLVEQAQFKQIFSPMIDLTRNRATFYAGLEVSTSDPNGYVPVPESAVNMSITSAEKLKSDYTGADFYYQGHYWYRADKIQFNLPIQFETLREKNSFAKEILLDDDSKTFIYEKEFRVTNPTATKINILYTVDPTALGFSVLQYPQFELDGVPMAEWRPSNSTTLYLIRTDSLEPGEISTHWMKSIWTISKEELEFPAKLDDFRSITTFEQARKLAENVAEGKTDTYVKVIKIDSNADVNNVTILVPLKDVEDSLDVIEAVALTGSRETLQVEELEDGKIVVKVPSEAFVSGHAEIKVLYNKVGKSGIFAIISKILAKIKELLRKLGLGGLIFWPVSHA